MFFSLTFFLARAGGGIGGGGHSSSGGSHFSSGGSHFSSGGTHTFIGGGGVSSGGGGGGGWIGALFIIPVIVIVLVLIYAAHRRSKAKAPSWPSSGAQRSPSAAASWPAPSAPAQEHGRAAAARGLDAIKSHDPGFDEDAFLATVERCFFAVEEAWSQQKPELSRPVMTDEAWQRQKAEIESYRNSGRRNVLDNLTVAKATIIAAGSEDGRDDVTVRFRAASANYDVDLASGKVVHGNHQMAFWEQDWVFQRSSRTSTNGDSTNGQRCPNCGAPLDLDIAGVCRNCNAAVRSGDGQWVVVRADQPQHVPG
jgi:predicted lipid-binding transport protein (Tim44 family)